MKAGSADRYFQKGCENNFSKLVPEGIAARVPFKGTLSETVYQLVGGVRAGMFYCGAKDIETLQRAQLRPHHLYRVCTRAIRTTWPLPAKRPTTAANVSYESRNRGLRAFFAVHCRKFGKGAVRGAAIRKGRVVQGSFLLPGERLAELRRMHAGARWIPAESSIISLPGFFRSFSAQRPPRDA